ncbi:MAG: imidazoleglycerol-phosphate dehydratase HisB [Methylacidiphilales bacterium]|nr:imidazoleglycerol-phosphate dehydratase HisB [Candidatus Methylacidiphilales bacterium]
MTIRTAEIKRITKETQITLNIGLDGSGINTIKTPIPFLNHMLEQVSKHGLIDIELDAKGDIEIDAHHTVEDCGIVLGQAIAKALGDKRGITRYGSSYIPLDEALSRVVIDLSGRPGLIYNVTYPRARVGDFDIDLLKEFFQALSNHCLATIHIDSLRGDNSHHIAETIFKAFGRALRVAVLLDTKIIDIPSTKGSL